MTGWAQREAECREDEAEELEELRAIVQRLKDPTEAMLTAGFAAYCQRMGEDHPGFADLTTSGREAFAAFYRAAAAACHT